jgi:hypothetical protein
MGVELTSLFHPNLEPNLKNTEIFSPRDKISQSIFLLKLNDMSLTNICFLGVILLLFVWMRYESCLFISSELIPFTGSMWIQLKWHYKCVGGNVVVEGSLLNSPHKTHTHTHDHAFINCRPTQSGTFADKAIMGVGCKLWNS